MKTPGGFSKSFNTTLLIGSLFQKIRVRSNNELRNYLSCKAGNMNQLKANS
jgi:hypothetical protein